METRPPTYPPNSKFSYSSIKHFNLMDAPVHTAYYGEREEEQGSLLLALHIGSTATETPGTTHYWRCSQMPGHDGREPKARANL